MTTTRRAVANADRQGGTGAPSRKRWSECPPPVTRARACRVYLSPVAAPVGGGPLPALMKASPSCGAPTAVSEREPLAPDLVGRLDHQAQLGELVVPRELVAL